MTGNGNRRTFHAILTGLQIALGLWLAFWAGVLVYHLWISGVILSRTETHDTYYTVTYFGSLALILSVSLVAVTAIALIKWRLRRRG